MSDEAKWTQLATRRIHSGRVLDLHVDTVRRPDGSTGDYEVVRHGAAAAVLPVIHRQPGQSEILLLRQYRYAAERELWEVPAGLVDPGETPEECARRELIEETGYSGGKFDPMCEMLTTPGFSDEVIHLFLAEDLQAGNHSREPDEFMTVESVSMKRAIELVRSGAVTDGKTALAILFAATFKGLD
jgi:ADP-ribose pyrophosphatase